MPDATVCKVFAIVASMELHGKLCRYSAVVLELVPGHYLFKAQINSVPCN